MLKYVQTIGVHVSNQEKALDFYVNTLGLEKIMDEPMDEQSRWIVVAPAGAQTGINLETHNGSGLMGRFTSYIFNTDDILATCEQLTARGVKFTVAPRLEPWGHWAQFTDLDGNEFGLWATPNQVE